MKKIIMILLISLLTLSACQQTTVQSDKLQVVATTTMLTDLVQQIGQDNVEVTGLMNAGVDPHLYKAKESDVSTLIGADLVIYNGVHLEAKLNDVLAKIEHTVAIESGLEETDLIGDGSGSHDPHIWFSVNNWKKAAKVVADALSEKDPEHQNSYQANLVTYLEKLNELDTYIKTRIAEVPESQRILVTAHDAFNYFARDYGFEVKAIQGISTVSEASTADISELARFVTTHQIRSVYVESSVPIKTIESLQDAVKALGFTVQIGEELFSDSLKENTSYIDTYKLNIDHIVDGLVE